MFRAFAEQTKSDLQGARRLHPRLAADADATRKSRGIKLPVLVAVGTKDEVAGSPRDAGGADPGRASAADPGPRSHAGGRRQGATRPACWNSLTSVPKWHAGAMRATALAAS